MQTYDPETCEFTVALPADLAGDYRIARAVWLSVASAAGYTPGVKAPVLDQGDPPRMVGKVRTPHSDITREPLVPSAASIEAAANAIAVRIDPRLVLTAAPDHVRRYYWMLATDALVAAGHSLVADAMRHATTATTYPAV